MIQEEKMLKDDCIFCKLANGVIPTNTIYEDEWFRVILDMAPATKGHALILPKSHEDNLFELSDENASKALILARNMAKVMKEKLQCGGLNLVQNNGEAAGQTVNHFHIHLIPRYQMDGQNINWAPGNSSAEELEAIKKQIIE